MNYLCALTEQQREICVQAGVIRRAAAKSGLTRATVSRTLSGDIKQPNPKAMKALKAEIGKALRQHKRDQDSYTQLKKAANL